MSRLVDTALLGVSLLDELGFERQLLTHDGFRNAALGDDGWAVSRWLSDELPVDAQHLSVSTGIPFRRVEGILGTLEANDAAFRSDGWLRPIEPAFFDGLDRIALDAGILGSLDRDRDSYAADRAMRDARFPEASRSLFVTLPPPDSWWSTWWGSLSERAVRDAA